MEGTLSVGLRIVGLTIAESDAEMPAKFIQTESGGWVYALALGA
jgi:hypothetical protein